MIRTIIKESKPLNPSNVKKIIKKIGRPPKTTSKRIEWIRSLISLYGLESRLYSGKQAIIDYKKVIDSLGCTITFSNKTISNKDKNGNPLSIKFDVSVEFQDGMTINGYLKLMAAGTKATPMSQYETMLILEPKVMRELTESAHSLVRRLLSEEEQIKPTVEWMKRKYAEFNEAYFHGALGECNFEAFTSGRGSEGGYLGRFRCGSKFMFVQRNVNSLHNVLYYSSMGIRHFINSNNFYQLFQPYIGINANYTFTENEMEYTLIHEMCHYYNYMNGTPPKKAHGPQFKQAMAMVESNSQGRFVVSRIQRAESSNFTLNDEMTKKEEKRMANKAKKLKVITYIHDGHTCITPTTSENNIEFCINYMLQHPNDFKNIKVVASPELSETLLKSGYRAFRTFRWYWIENKPKILELTNKAPEVLQILMAR